MYLVDLTRDGVAEIRAVARADTPTHARLRDSLVLITLVTVAIDVVCAAVALLLEHGARGTQIHTYGSALFWTSTQLLTVSSQLPNPISVGGRILDIAMEAYAITVVGSLAGTLGAFFVRRARETEEGERARGVG